MLLRHHMQQTRTLAPVNTPLDATQSIYRILLLVHPN